MGTLSEMLGKNDKALEKHRGRPQDLAAERVADDRRTSSTRRNLALCDNQHWLTARRVRLAARKRVAAIRKHGTASRHRSKNSLLATDSESSALATDLATTCNNLGLVLREAGRTSEAIEQFRAAIAHDDPLVKQQPK